MPGITHGQPIYICDNGGFESGFSNYLGKLNDNFNRGSSDCIPETQTGFNPDVFAPSTWNGISIPSYRRFEIVSTGTDLATGFQIVKKGSKSAKINNLLSHGNDNCITEYDGNKLIKSFEVDPDNRIFTIWYSVVFEYDPAHNSNSHPYFHINCDLASNDELCFDAGNLPASIFNYNHTCLENENDIKATNWTCHTIIIPEEEVGNIATLEITASDCGCNYHFGYAYIDAFCEPCDSSSLGGGKFQDFSNGLGITKTCTGDTIELCGTYYLPSIGSGYSLSSFDVPGVTAYNKTIDSTSKTFCFKVEQSDFEDPLCRDVYALLNFTNSSGTLPPVVTKPHTICYGDFVVPELDIEVGDCNRNNPTDEYMSDDYYYVSIEVTDASYVPWVIKRLLHNPYPGEGGAYQIKSGVGDGSHQLGPFMIQEGIWRLILEYNGCVDTFLIEPPDYCSGCTELGKTKITNVLCTGNNQWTYDIEVEFAGATSDDYFKIGSGVTEYSLNQAHTFSGGTIGTSCREVAIKFILNDNEQCERKFNICPPQKCNNLQCDIKAQFIDIDCINNDTEFNIDIDVLNATCYKYKYGTGAYTSGDLITNPLGPFSFNGDVTLMFYSCSSPTSCTCSINGCYKLVYVHMPDDCESRDFGGTQDRTSNRSTRGLEVFPNPIASDEFIIRSSLNLIDFELYNLNGFRLMYGSLTKGENRILINIPPGIYYIQYFDSSNKKQVLKLIKV